MVPLGINPENTVFTVLSWEGPDPYSQAGGLGVRIAELTEALARAGFTTHLFFIGDPHRDGQESRNDGKLILHRWCQWLSHHYPDGVYHGEEAKLWDFNNSIPHYVANQIVGPAAAEGKMAVVMGEEWHTSEALSRISDLLHHLGLRNQVLTLWNANNIFSFDRINWGRLAYTTTVTTVSRYMKHLMWRLGVNPWVIPNGIPKRLLEPVDRSAAQALREAIGRRLILFKVGRWHVDKRWEMAMDAIVTLKAMGRDITFLVRGGIEPHGGEVLGKAHANGLEVKDTWNGVDQVEGYLQALRDAGGADVLNFKQPISQEMLRVFYYLCDGVLANSGHEPFGLVGLETMAAGGVAYTGGTGEDYAVPLGNAVVLESEDPAEIVSYVNLLESQPHLAQEIRTGGHLTAQAYTWEKVIDNLLSKLEFLARRRGMIRGG
jgi:glycosyltransferase involved in cell wall biosynthesis